MSIVNLLIAWFARLIASRNLGSRRLRIRAWAWLAAHTDDLEEQMRCLKAVVALDPDLVWAQAALTRLWYRWRRES